MIKYTGPINLRMNGKGGIGKDIPYISEARAFLGKMIGLYPEDATGKTWSLTLGDGTQIIAYVPSKGMLPIINIITIPNIEESIVEGEQGVYLLDSPSIGSLSTLHFYGDDSTRQRRISGNYPPIKAQVVTIPANGGYVETVELRITPPFLSVVSLMAYSVYWPAIGQNPPYYIYKKNEILSNLDDSSDFTSRYIIGIFPKDKNLEVRHDSFIQDAPDKTTIVKKEDGSLVKNSVSSIKTEGDFPKTQPCVNKSTLFSSIGTSYITAFDRESESLRGEVSYSSLTWPYAPGDGTGISRHNTSLSCNKDISVFSIQLREAPSTGFGGEGGLVVNFTGERGLKLIFTNNSGKLVGQEFIKYQDLPIGGSFPYPSSDGGITPIKDRTGDYSDVPYLFEEESGWVASVGISNKYIYIFGNGFGESYCCVYPLKKVYSLGKIISVKIGNLEKSIEMPYSLLPSLQLGQATFTQTGFDSSSSMPVMDYIYL